MESSSGTDSKERTTTGTTARNVTKVKEEPREVTPLSSKSTDTPDQGTALTDFAETTMNELLGWYGYDKVVDREDTQGLNLQRFTGRNSPHTPTPNSDHDGTTRDSVSNTSCESDPRDGALSPGSGSEIAAHHQTLVTALTSNKSPSSSSKSPNSQPEIPTSPGTYIVCAWCQKPGLKLFTLKTETTTKVFCSELCFTQCRRASFRKNKVCDWCKHVRHTVNYVDFQDGEQQLQFCSDKCLNQYKMNIFCKETQEHLQLIHTPQGQQSTNVAESSTPPIVNRGGSNSHNNSQILITPDLWMQNGEDGQASKKRRRKNSSSEDIDDLDDAEEGDGSGDCSTVDTAITEVKPDITKMNVKTEVLSSSQSRDKERDTLAVKGVSERQHGVMVDSSRRHLKVEHAVRERIRRIRSRDSTCTPLAVATSPSSSQMSTPPSATSGLTPPGVQMQQPLPPMPLVGALPPGILAPPHYFYQQLMASGVFPAGLPPHAAWMVPQHPGAHGANIVPQGIDNKSQVRNNLSGVSPTPESVNQSRSAQPPTIGNPGSGTSTTTSGTPPPASSSASSISTINQPPASPGKFPGPLPPFPPPGFPNLPGMPPGIPMPFPPGVHPVMMPPPHPTLPGGPPVTVMVPYPVLLPVPVPIPIPVPIRCDKDLRDFALIMKSANPTGSNTTTANTSKYSRSQSSLRTQRSAPSSTSVRPASVPLKSACSPASSAICIEQRRCHTDDEKENSESAANCENGGSSNGEEGSGGIVKYKIACACCQQSNPDHQNPTIQNSAGSSPCKVDGSLTMADLGLRPSGHSSTLKSTERLDINNTHLASPDDDVAIDLSKDKTKSFSLGPGVGGGSSLELHHHSTSSSTRTLPATITVKSEPAPPPLVITPLQSVGGFLMPPRDHAYSSRRSMILDAPSVPRADRSESSSSPEKRLMLRSPNRDVMFAKRRCMRTRIKSK